MIRRATGFFGILLSLVFFIACSSKKDASKQSARTAPPIIVDVLVATAKPVSNNLEVNGTVVANEYVELHPEASGRLTFLYVPEGRLITINEIRERVAKKHKATIGCPITTGIFAWIAAHAAEEASDAGATSITPYWRTLKVGGELNPKYPGGIDRLKALLEAEGHSVITKGKRHFVADYARSVVRK